MADGGYDEGYRSCPCFWGNEPGSYVRLLFDRLGSFEGLACLDAGSGEGKNAIFVAAHGGTVEAIEVSALAQQNGTNLWEPHPSITWRTDDICTATLSPEGYDVVIAYGLLHCMPSVAIVDKVIDKLQASTRQGGYNIICAFNSRHQELHAHPGFSPTLLAHVHYTDRYASGWQVINASDTDLVETHPHNGIEHTHSMTRILARKGDK